MYHSSSVVELHSVRAPQCQSFTWELCMGSTMELHSVGSLLWSYKIVSELQRGVVLCAPSSIEASDHPHPLTAPACKQSQTFVNVRSVPIRGICTECSNICENMFSVAGALGGGRFAPLWLLNKAVLWCHSCGGIRPEVAIISNTIIYFIVHN